MKLNLFNKNDEASALWPALSKGWEEMKYSIKETVSLQPAAFTSDLLKPSPNYRGTSGLSVSLTFLTLFFKKKKKKQTHTFPHRMPQWKENRPSIFRPQFAKKDLELFFLIKAPHNLKNCTCSIYSVLKHHTYCTGSSWKGPPLSRTATDSTMKGQQGALLPSFLPGWPPGF